MSTWVWSKDAGYSSNALLLDLPNGHLVSVRKSGSRWIKAMIHNKVCYRTEAFKTQTLALQSGHEEFVKQTIYQEAEKFNQGK